MFDSLLGVVFCHSESTSGMKHPEKASASFSRVLGRGVILEKEEAEVREVHVQSPFTSHGENNEHRASSTA